MDWDLLGLAGLMFVLAACLAGLAVVGAHSLAGGGAAGVTPGHKSGVELRAHEALLNALRAETGTVYASGGAADMRVLRAVNSFFNRISPRPLAAGRAAGELWATPDEFADGKGGSPADYVIAKYYALTSIGVSSSRLRVFVVGRDSHSAPHYVLAYYMVADAAPMILDHLDPVIRPAEERADLRPVYSFDPGGGAGGVQHRMWREMSERITGNKA